MIEEKRDKNDNKKNLIFSNRTRNISPSPSLPSPFLLPTSNSTAHYHLISSMFANSFFE